MVRFLKKHSHTFLKTKHVPPLAVVLQTKKQSSFLVTVCFYSLIAIGCSYLKNNLNVHDNLIRIWLQDAATKNLSLFGYRQLQLQCKTNTCKYYIPYSGDPSVQIFESLHKVHIMSKHLKFCSFLIYKHQNTPLYNRRSHRFPFRCHFILFFF